MHFKNMNDLLPFKFQFDVCTGGQWGVPPLLAFRPRKIKYTKKSKNCKLLSYLIVIHFLIAFVFVFLLVRSCLLITLIKCLKIHKCPG